MQFAFVGGDSAECNKIGWSAFGWCDALSSVVFAGTKAEWNAVEKERCWLSEYSAIECVQCADGVVKR